MKKTIACTLIIATTLGLFSGCSCDHDWIDADCTSPKTCAKCHETRGDEKGHKWIDATCDTPKTCSECDKEQGKPLEHDWQDATCLAPITCKLCGKKDGKELGHEPGKWVIESINSITMSAEQKQYCNRCNEELDSKTETVKQLHDGETFLISAQTFTVRLNNEINNWADDLLGANEYDSDGSFSCAITHSTNILGLTLFSYDDEYISYESKNSAAFDRVSTIFSIGGDDNTWIDVMCALVTTCDPSLTHSEAIQFITSLASIKNLTKNGLRYQVTSDGSRLALLITVE